MTRYASAGALLTTPSDYARFVIGVLEPRDGDPFRLNSRTVTAMLQPQVKVDESVSWALGWALQQTPRGELTFHSGGIEGAHCRTVLSVPRKNGVVIMTNGQNGSTLIEKLMSSDPIGALV